jgi:hypothetical protein
MGVREKGVVRFRVGRMVGYGMSHERHCPDRR